jgi:hypothetical protein
LEIAEFRFTGITDFAARAHDPILSAHKQAPKLLHTHATHVGRRGPQQA